MDEMLSLLWVILCYLIGIKWFLVAIKYRFEGVTESANFYFIIAIISTYIATRNLMEFIYA